MILNNDGGHPMTFCHNWGAVWIWGGSPPLGAYPPSQDLGGFRGKRGSVPFINFFPEKLKKI
jgi:hypothetical protein